MVLSWDDTLSITIPLLASVPLFIAVKAYRRTTTTRVLFFTAAFGALFLKGVVIAVEVLLLPNNDALDAMELLLEAAVIVLFFLGMTRA